MKRLSLRTRRTESPGWRSENKRTETSGSRSLHTVLAREQGEQRLQAGVLRTREQRLQAGGLRTREQRVQADVLRTREQRFQAGVLRTRLPAGVLVVQSVSLRTRRTKRERTKRTTICYTASIIFRMASTTYSLSQRTRSA